MEPFDQVAEGNFVLRNGTEEVSYLWVFEPDKLAGQ